MEKEIVIVDEVINGFVKTDYQPVNRYVNTLTDSILPIKFMLSTPSSNRALKAYLEIHSIPLNLNYARWKIWFNSFPLSKEYKPNFSAEVGNASYGLFIYDVTPIVNRDINRRSHKLIIKNVGSTPLYVSYALLTVQFEKENVETRHEYRVIMSSCKHDAPCFLRPARCSPDVRSQSRVNGYSPHSPVEFYLGTKHWRKTILSPTKVIDVVLEECVDDQVFIMPINRSHDIYILTAHSFASRYERPVLDVKTSNAHKDGRVEVSLEITNKGNAEANELLVVGILHGTIVYRNKIDRLKPDEARVESFVIEKPKEAATLTIRVAWNELGEIFFKEYKVPL